MLGVIAKNETADTSMVVIDIGWNVSSRDVVDTQHLARGRQRGLAMVTASTATHLDRSI